MRIFYLMCMFITIGFMFSGLSEAGSLSATQEKSIIDSSLKYVLEGVEVSPFQRTASSYTAFPKKFKPVEKLSSNGIKFTMWPFKVSGDGCVTARTQLLSEIIEQKYAVAVSYTVYVYFNETDELKFEVSDVKVFRSQKID